jgi:hypothetical protein
MEVRLFYLVVSLLSGLVVSFSALGAKFQPVYSLKKLGEQQDAVGNSFQRVQVKCNTGRELRYLHRDVGAQVWCVNGNSAECFEERMDAATRACSVDSGSIIAPATGSAAVAVKQPSAEQLRKQTERDDLQKELMINQQKKIELRTQQLELRKRELELKTQRDSNY